MQSPWLQLNSHVTSWSSLQRNGVLLIEERKLEIEKPKVAGGDRLEHQRTLEDLILSVLATRGEPSPSAMVIVMDGGATEAKSLCLYFVSINLFDAHKTTKNELIKRPWQYDCKVTYEEITNTFTLVHRGTGLQTLKERSSQARSPPLEAQAESISTRPRLSPCKQVAQSGARSSGTPRQPSIQKPPRKCKLGTEKSKVTGGDRLDYQRTLVDLILNILTSRGGSSPSTMAIVVEDGVIESRPSRKTTEKRAIIKLAPLPGTQVPLCFHVPKPRQMENHDRTLKELTTLDVVYQPWCIQYPQLEPAQTYELKSGLIHLLPKFHGLAGEDPHKHLKEFHV
ncbi:hypothetical protein CR513_09734, partial [Mucuna pruriens]